MSATDPTDPTARDNPRNALHGAARDAVHEIGTASVDADNPWLGLSSFTEETRAYFFGREGEVAELERRVQRKLLTVLFGKSGLGKTSILRAGLVPGLRAPGYFPVYLRIDYGRESPEPAEQIKQGIGKAAASGEWTQTDVSTPGESIWEFLHHRDDVLKDKSGSTLIPLLIFDQFEELFTLAQSDEFGRARAAKFIEELSDLVENRPPKALEAKLESDESIAERFDFSRSDYRVVMALREDYLAPLESLKKLMPSLSQNRLRLAPMTGSQALESVLQPGNRLRPGKPLVSEEIAEAIVRFVAGGSELANAEVEPSLLSLICRELNEQRIAQRRTEISQDLLAGSHETILSNFYERSLSDQPESVRRIVEDNLLTESGYRENLAEESLLKRFQVAGAAPDALAKLVNRRLVRIEERLDVRRVELTHDVLTGVVKASRDARHERETREATERMLAEQRAREEAAHRALRRTQAVAAGCTLLALVAIAAAIFALVSFRHARHAELVAQQTRVVSEQARQEAEGLLGFLTNDFVNELETFGRYQTIAELTQREIDYFQRLPPQLQDAETLRSGALALVNHANAFLFLGNPSAGIQSADAAIALLEPLRRDGDRSDSTATILAQAYVARGALRGNQSSGGDHADFARAADLLRPLAGRPDAPLQTRLTYITALTDVGESATSYEDTVRDETEAMRLADRLGVHGHAGIAVDAAYATAGQWIGVPLVRLGRSGEALRVGEDALAVADRILAQRPQFGRVLFAKQMIEANLANAGRDELDPAEALRFATQSEQTALAMIRLEPNDTVYTYEFGGAYNAISNALWDGGRLNEALIFGRKSAGETGQSRGVGTFYLANSAAAMTDVALREAQLGDLSGADAVVASLDTLLNPTTLHQLGPSAPASDAVVRALRAIVAAASAEERGDFAAMWRIAHTARAALPAQVPYRQALFLDLSDLQGHAEYSLGRFAAAEQSERTLLKADKATGSLGVNAQRSAGQIAIWLSMALAREGRREEAAQIIGPLVTMYRGLEKRNHGDQWLPLEFAEALYAQSLTDNQHRAALLREASHLVDHLIPSIAQLHDTRQWRARIEAEQRRARAAPAR